METEKIKDFVDPGYSGYSYGSGDGNGKSGGEGSLFGDCRCYSDDSHTGGDKIRSFRSGK